jgi:type I restriction enzyme S subunit
MGNDGWINKRFDQCAELIRETVDPKELNNVPYIGLEHIAQESLCLVGYGTSGDVNSAKSRFKKGDILFGKLRPYFRKVVIAPFDGVCSTDIWVVRSKPETDKKFLFYWMASHEFIEESTRSSEGTRMPRAQWEFVSRIERLVPQQSEQRAIGNILGALDDKIELNRQMCKTLEETAQAIFKSWFVDFDPVHAKAAGKQPEGLKPEIAALFPDSFEDSEFGKIPKGWISDGLDRLGAFLNGLALQKYPPNEDNWLPAIKITQLRTNNSQNADRVSESIADDYIVQDGDILFSWSGSLECVIWTGGKGALNQHLFRVTSDEYPKWFIYFWIRYHLPEFRHIAAGKATTMGHIQRHHIRDAKVVIPSHDILDRAHRTINPMFESIVSRSLESKRLENLRDLLTPQLLAGRIRT